MVKTANQLARYRIIDECLQNRIHQPSSSDNPEHRGLWTIDDLLEAVNRKLDSRISDRTLKEDLRRMREDVDLSYFAPIKNKKGIGYYYDDPEYRLTEAPLSRANVETLQEIISMLSQFKGFKYFEEADGLIYNIEKSIQRSTFFDIQLDTLPNYSGLKFIEPLKKAIREKTVLKMMYKSFDMEIESPFHIHPYLLKEYNNRWFVFAYTNEYRSEGVYGLDRIISVQESPKRYKVPNKKRISEYFKNIIGVTNYEDREVEDIVLRLTRYRANYLITKPIHHSQRIIKESAKYVWFGFHLKPNNELNALILHFGHDAVVEKPKQLAREIADILQEALNHYQLT